MSNVQGDDIFKQLLSLEARKEELYFYASVI